jgi:hypothetical protein
MNKWLSFYVSFFTSTDKARKFVEACEAQPAEANRAKIIMHQTQRLVSIADKIPQIRPGRVALQILFLIVCAECVAKLYKDFKGEGKSHEHVQIFFNDLLTDDDKELIGNGFRTIDSGPLGLKAAVDVLYAVRCDVVHEGQYWAFSLKENESSKVNVGINGDGFLADVRYEDIRNAVVRGAIRAAKRRL